MLKSRLTFDSKTEGEYQKLTEIEKEEAVVFTVSQKKIKQLVEGLDRI